MIPYMKVKVLKEAGYEEALLGISLNKNQPIENMPSVATKLAFHDGGHNKFLESMMVWLDVTAPRYWWQEADTFRLSTKNSQSTMHTILKGYLSNDDFETTPPRLMMEVLNQLVEKKELTELKSLLPEGFLQRRVWCMSYKTLRNIILQRRTHRLPHWHVFIDEVLQQVAHEDLLPPHDPKEDKSRSSKSSE